MEMIYDVIVIGAGPAGMNAAFYASRANMKTLIIEKECPGGKMMKTKVIDNYIGGSTQNAMELASNMFSQAIQYGAKYKQGNVVSIVEDSLNKKVILSNGEEFFARALILAVGGKLSSETFKYDHYLNKGLSYCVVCDANFYKNKNVALIGDNKSLDDVDYLSRIVKKVYFINSDNKQSQQINVENFTNIKDYTIYGADKIESIEVNGNQIAIDGAFYVKDTNSFNGFSSNLELDRGYIKVDNNMHTNIEGIYACGDIVNRNIKQVISACGDGASAALEAIKYVNKMKRK
jgi:thioredoxin reductase (NADPH)